MCLQMYRRLKALRGNLQFELKEPIHEAKQEGQSKL